MEVDTLSIYGFGSFFNNESDYNDIDVLITHHSSSYHSCQLAIWCKKRLLELSSEFDVTILSISEENQLSFVAKSNAVTIGKIRAKYALNDLKMVFEKISRIKVRK